MTTELKPGMKIWRFRLEKLLARGGMGSVWAARDERLDREVALKLLPHVLVNEPSAARRFEREARAMARLQHPNVVGIFDVGTFDPGVGEELPYLVMELIRGRSLNELLDDGPMPPRLAARVVEQVALALAAAHAVGVIHRDLKPSNVMVGDGGHVTVLDFGLALLAQRAGETSIETLTSPGMVLGSCPYMAPEQALGKEVTTSSDIFSCGAVLYETLSGERAFDGPTPMKVLQAVVQSDYRPLAAVAPETPPELVAVVERCLAKEPNRRYRSSVDLARDLAIFQGTDETSLAEAPTVAFSSGKLQAVTARRRRLAMRAVGLGVVVLALGLVAGGLAARLGREPLRPDPGRWGVSVLYDAAGTLVDPEWSPSGEELVVAWNQAGRSRVLAVDVAHRVDPNRARRRSVRGVEPAAVLTRRQGPFGRGCDCGRAFAAGGACGGRPRDRGVDQRRWRALARRRLLSLHSRGCSGWIQPLPLLSGTAGGDPGAGGGRRAFVVRGRAATGWWFRAAGWADRHAG